MVLKVIGSWGLAFAPVSYIHASVELAFTFKFYWRFLSSVSQPWSPGLGYTRCAAPAKLPTKRCPIPLVYSCHLCGSAKSLTLQKHLFTTKTESRLSSEEERAGCTQSSLLDTVSWVTWRVLVLPCCLIMSVVVSSNISQLIIYTRSVTLLRLTRVKLNRVFFPR